MRVPLTPKAFDLLRLLVEHGGALVPKQQIIEALWPDTFVEETNLSVQVAAVRKALAAYSSDRFIETVARRGDRFVAPVERVAHAPELGPRTAAQVRVTVLPLKTIGPLRDAGTCQDWRWPRSATRGGRWPRCAGASASAPTAR